MSQAQLERTQEGFRVSEEGISVLFDAATGARNVEVWKDHYVTPYMCDLFISPRAEEFEEVWDPNVVYPYVTFPVTHLSEFDEDVIPTGSPRSDPLVTTDQPFYMCPATEAHSDLHAWRDVNLARDYGVHGICCGEWEVPAIAHGAWQSPEGGSGLLFAVLGTDRAQLRLDFDPALQWDLARDRGSIAVSTRNGIVKSTAIGDGRLTMDLDLDSRTVYLVEILDEGVR